MAGFFKLGEQVALDGFYWKENAVHNGRIVIVEEIVDNPVIVARDIIKRYEKGNLPGVAGSIHNFIREFMGKQGVMYKVSDTLVIMKGISRVNPDTGKEIESLEFETCYLIQYNLRKLYKPGNMGFESLIKTLKSPDKVKEL